MAPDPSVAIDFRGIATEAVTATESVAGATPQKAECSIDSPALGGIFSRRSLDTRGEAEASEQRRLMAAVYGDFVGVRDFAARVIKEVKILEGLCARATAVKAFLDSGDGGNVSAKEVSALCNEAMVEAERVLLPIISSDETSRWLDSVAMTKEVRDRAGKGKRSTLVFVSLSTWAKRCASSGGLCDAPQAPQYTKPEAVSHYRGKIGVRAQSAPHLQTIAHLPRVAC